MLPVSAVIITFNEEDNLRLSLPKLYWCDEIIIVDCGSNDNTVKICNQYQCNIHYRMFDDYSRQKKYAVSLAKNDWVLCLDADETLSDKLVEELKIEMCAPVADGYLMPLALIFMGKEFRYGKEAHHHFLRLFNREKGTFNDNMLHEKIAVKGNTKKLSNKVYHYSYKSIEHYFYKFNRYSSKGAEMALIKGKQRSSLAIVLSIPFYFCKYYFLERNFMNGLHGFSWSVLSAYYHFVKYLKLREAHLQKIEMDELGIPVSDLLNIKSQPRRLQNQLSE